MEKLKRNILAQKIKAFIKKFYLNRLIKGSILLSSSLLIVFLLLALTEFYSYFNPITRFILFYSYLISHCILFIYLVVIPIMKIFGITPILSYHQSSKIIGSHFPQIKDKLLNTLQLIEKSNDKEYELLNAAITKKIQNLKPFVFHKAVNLKVNRKYLVYLIVPTSVFIFLLLASPSLITDPTERILNYNKEYSRPLPYRIEIVNSKFSALQGEDYELHVKVKGKTVPGSVYLKYNNNKIPLRKTSTTDFTYTFKNLQKTLNFQLFTQDYSTKYYTLDVLLKPSLQNFSIHFTYPSYLNKENSTLWNNGNVTIPEGTRLNWKYYTHKTDSIKHIQNNKEFLLTRKDDVFRFSQHYYSDKNYKVTLANQMVQYRDTLNYRIQVIKDEYPRIFIEQFKDSILNTQIYFTGNIHDDYGFHDLQFYYDFVNDSSSNNISDQGIDIPINLSTNKQQFYYTFDFSSINSDPDEEIQYYFVVRDNDRPHKYKKAVSRKYIYKRKSEKEIQDKSNTITEDIKKNIEKSLDQVFDFNKEMDDLKKSLLEKETLDWEDKEKIRKLMEEQENLEKSLNEIEQLQKDKALFDEKVAEQDQSLLDKQKQLEDLLEKIMTDEMKQQIEELQELLEKFNNKQQMDQKLDEMKMSNEDLEKQLERQLELFKSFELQQKLQNTIENLDKIEKDQKELSIQTENELEENTKLQKEQEELKEQFNELEKDVEDIRDKNNELQEPYKLDDTQKEQQSIDENMEQSMQELEQNKNSKSTESQNKASQSMQKMQNKLNAMMNAMQQQSASEDLNKLRELLENVVKVSFDQEDLLNQFKKTNRNDPDYVNLIRDQKNIQEDIQMIEDTLYKISKRQAQIEPVVSKKISEINYNLEQALHFAAERRIAGTKTRQQYIMTGLNDLALLLAESIESLQQQMGMGMGKGKPSQSKPSQSSMPSLMQMQQQLNQQIQQLKKELQNGQQSSQSQKSGQSTSERLARMAAEQAAIRRKLQQLGKQYDSEGAFKLSKLLKEAAKRMEQTEKELVNKIISKQTLNRQKEIETRMLESERAERKQEKEKKRISEEAKNEVFGNKIEFFKYNSLNKDKEYELLKTVSPKLNNYYKTKVKQYFYNIEE